mmetsp:Transcript_30003/g.79079  ORF Transcript_30003/g.79079 Transcript_30003/m.79079 type:complete len:209 (+) Transcript_30003:1438-2064(+)
MHTSRHQREHHNRRSCRPRPSLIIKPHPPPVLHIVSRASSLRLTHAPDTRASTLGGLEPQPRAQQLQPPEAKSAIRPVPLYAARGSHVRQFHHHPAPALGAGGDARGPLCRCRTSRRPPALILDTSSTTVPEAAPLTRRGGELGRDPLAVGEHRKSPVSVRLRKREGQARQGGAEGQHRLVGPGGHFGRGLGGRGGNCHSRGLAREPA